MIYQQEDKADGHDLRTVITSECLVMAVEELQKKTQPSSNSSNLKFIYSEKATKFCEIFTLLLTGQK